MMIQRQDVLETLRAALDRNPVKVLISPRQCGKPTLARERAVMIQLAMDDPIT